MEIPFLDLKNQNAKLKTKILALWAEILDSACFIGGEHVAAFEKEFASACSVKHCITVSSGTDALRFILIALGLKEGDEVITVPNTFIATTEAITQAGGKIVFVDIDHETYNMNPSKLESVITPKTKGIIPVHLYGQPAEMDSIQSIADSYGLWIIEDACQAHLSEYKGRKAGSMGIAGAFSFYPGKNLGACGEAGAVTTNDDGLALKVRMLRDHGQSKKYYHNMEGYNGRCDAIQAAALRVKLRYLPSWNEARRVHARHYIDLLKHLDAVILPKEAKNCLSVYHLFVIQLENRDAIAEHLYKKGVSTGLHYPIPLHLQKAYTHMKIPRGSFPIAEVCSEKLLSLPIFPELNKAQIFHICQELNAATNKFTK